MPRDINGNTSPLTGTIVNTGDTITPSQHNPALFDLYAMMTQSLSRDGQGGMRTNLDMSGFRILNVGAAQNDSDPVTLAQLKLACPVGKIDDYAGATAPETWMLCFGQAVSRTSYPDLFAAIGTTFGVGDGSTTFNLPDLRGRAIAGKDDMGGTSSTRLSAFWATLATTLGGVFGTASHVLTTGQMPSHTHVATVNDPGHLHTDDLFLGTAVGGGLGIVGNNNAGNINVVNTATTGITVTNASQGSGEAHTNTQPTMVLNKIIKVSY